MMNLALSILRDHHIAIIVSLILFVAAISDLKEQRIPNYMTFPSALLALAIHTALSGMDGFLFALYGMLSGTFLLIIPYMMGGMGAGDAKLMGAVGAFLGAKAVFVAFLFTALLGGIYAVALVLVRRDVFKGFFREQYEAFVIFLFTKKYVKNIPVGGRRPRLCYGIAIALGTYIYIGLDVSGIRFF